MIKTIFTLITPVKLVQAFIYHLKNKKYDKSTYDLELHLYSNILKNDMLHYGYFEDVNIQADHISIKQLEDAQLKYAENIVKYIINKDEPVLDVGCGMGGLSNILLQKGYIVDALTPNENQIGDYEIILIAVNAGGSDSQTWTISAGPSIVSFPPASATTGEKYTYSPEVSGQGAITWSLTQNPEGMVIDEDSGHLTWVPHEGQVQTHTVTLKVAVNGKEDSQSWTITVAAGSSEPADGFSGGSSGCFLPGRSPKATRPWRVPSRRPSRRRRPRPRDRGPQRP